MRSDAIEILKEANLVSPDDSAIPFYLGQYYLEDGDTTKSLEWWMKYAEMDKEDYEVLFQIGYIYLEGGTYIDYPKAEEIYQEMVDRHPDQCKGWINLGVAQIKQDKTKIGADNVKKGEECSKQ
jgi:tetratricopeptide (TPR) repeat protein